MAGIVVIGGGLSLHAVLEKGLRAEKLKDVKVTVIQACDFHEWSLAATHFICNPDRYDEFAGGDASKWRFPGVSYVHSPAVSVDREQKVVVTRSGDRVSYEVLVVATGYHVPLIHREPGVSFAERKAELEKFGNAIASAKVIVVNGPGAIGLEMVGDARLRNPAARVVLLSRSGTLLSSAYPKDVLERVKAALDRMRIELVQATVTEAVAGSGDGGRSPAINAGSGQLQLTGHDPAVFDGTFDIYLPCFNQGLHTGFLPPELLDEKTKSVNTNEYLQSTADRAVFAVGVNTSKEGFAAMKLSEQGVSVGRNVLLQLQGKPLKVHKDKMAKLDIGTRPPTIKIGYGKGGWIMWDNVPQPNKTCMRCCGFPCGPCGLCCFSWNACFMCGYCCMPPAGEPAARGYEAVVGVGGIKAFPKFVCGPRYASFGTKYAPPQQQMN